MAIFLDKMIRTSKKKDTYRASIEEISKFIDHKDKNKSIIIIILFFVLFAYLIFT